MLTSPWPHLHHPQSTAVAACDLALPPQPPLPPYPTQQGHTSKRAVGRGGPREKTTDSPIVTETIVVLALTLLPGAWKREQGERAHESPPAMSVWPSLTAYLSACQRRVPGLGAQSPGIAWSSWQEVSLGQSCHNYHFCLGQGPGTANVHSCIPIHLKCF